jgi:type II secretory ATPase GspE/PulE/Tfp pilus assembly ATPase PilB-like protein
MQAIDHRPTSLVPPIARAAKLQLLDGTTREGKVIRFSATAPELMFEPSSAASAHASRQRINCEDIALIFFGDGSRATVPPPKATRLNIVLVNGSSLIVDAVLENKPATGFHARTEDGNAEVFVYDHAVRTKERVELLGTMLVKAGAATRESIRVGLDAQSTARRMTIGEILVAQRRVEQSAVEQAAVLQSRRKLRLGEVLIEEGLVSREHIEAALVEQQKNRGRRLGAILVELGLVAEEALSATIARKFCMPFVDLSQVEIDEAAVREIPREVIEKHGFLPLGSDDRTLTVGICDPLDASAADVMRFHTKKRIVEVVVTRSQLEEHIARLLRGEKEPPAPAIESSREIERLLEELASSEAAATVAKKAATETQPSESDSAVIKLTNRILLDAVMRGASDVHIETNGTEHNSVVRLRIDGDCVPYQELPPVYRRSIVARLKIMADLDISERRKPQDGKIRFRMPDRIVELRVATIPTVNDNEDMVLRVLANARPKPIDRLELSPRNLSALRELIAKPYGLLLCVGPTGSGKTTTLHSVLGAINTPDMKIWTAEDPVEITQPGLRQVQVNARIGFTFAAAMRSFLRADPDVIMVGEMRDTETAGTAIEASLTGHLVLSTLHTNSAPETVTRLLDMGLDPFSFGDALLGVLAQRLVRAFCSSCREPYGASVQEIALIERTYGEPGAFRAAFGLAPNAPVQLHRARGCSACGGSGYKGRVAVHELLVSDERVRAAVTRKVPAEELRRLAIAGGMTTLAQDGITKCLAGLTDVRQVLGACSR